jgi:hypothetical protein
MSVQIRIKVRGKWYKALTTGWTYETCDKCPLRRMCNNDSLNGYQIRRICDAGFREIKELPNDKSK